MGADRTGPWWYSGPREGTGPDQVEFAAGDQGSGDQTSGDQTAGDQTAGDQTSAQAGAADRAAPGLAGLIDGAQRLVGWAAQAVLTPHAQHGAPAEHPACVLCQASTLLGDAPAVLERLAARSRPAEPASDRHPSIRWLPVRDER